MNKFTFNCCGHEAPIAKQANSEDPPSIVTIHAIADAREPSMTKNVRQGFADLRSQTSESQLVAQINQNGLASAPGVIDFFKLEDDMGAVQEDSQSALESALKTSVKFLPLAAAGAVITKPEDRRVLQFLDKNSGQFIRNITDQTRLTIDQVIRRAAREQLSVEEAALQIRNGLGLTPKMENALNNFKQGLVEDKLPPARVINLTEKRRQKMLKVRSTAIARTELIRSVNFGQLELMRQAADQGLIGRDTTTKTWVVTRDDRLSDICRALEGQTVLLMEMFFSPVTGEWLEAPPAHVNCRSGLVFRFG